MGNTSTEDLRQQVTTAQQAIQVGEIYSHYKDHSRRYRIVAIAIDEASESISIVYQALYDPYLTWIRPLNNFQELVTWQDERVPRFQLEEGSKAKVA